jgi:translation elongation factor EF-Tu-like GTPase
MTDLYSTEPDFEAEITILTEEERGRQTPPHNYIRWDFGYADDNPLEPERNLDKEIYMIWPNFLDDDGTPIQKGIPLIGTYKARMHILVKEMMDYHRKRISVGLKFNCHEGARIMARGVVTKLRAISTDGS